MSHSSTRLVATIGVLVAGTVLASASVAARNLPDSTWVALSSPADTGGVAILSLAVDPANNQVMLAGLPSGSLYRTMDGGSTWTEVRHGSGAQPVLAVAFNPFQPGQAYAGLRSGGALATSDHGATWVSSPGLEGRDIRGLTFAKGLSAAATDRGVFLNLGSGWVVSGLSSLAISAVAATAVNPPVRMIAAAEAAVAGTSPALFQSADAGATWAPVTATLGGTRAVARLIAGPLPPTGTVRPILLGSNAGLFASSDNGATFAPLSGGGQLPAVDITQLAFVTDHNTRFYAASDGGGSVGGGLWATSDGGSTFVSRAAPVGSVTALAVSNDEAPIIYIATFRPTDHATQLWAFHDTGGTPAGPVLTPTPTASAARAPGPTHPATTGLAAYLALPQTPYVALGAGALLILLLAVVAHFRSARR